MIGGCPDQRSAAHRSASASPKGIAWSGQNRWFGPRTMAVRGHRRWSNLVRDRRRQSHTLDHPSRHWPSKRHGHTWTFDALFQIESVPQPSTGLVVEQTWPSLVKGRQCDRGTSASTVSRAVSVPRSRHPSPRSRGRNTSQTWTLSALLILTARSGYRRQAWAAEDVVSGGDPARR